MVNCAIEKTVRTVDGAFHHMISVFCADDVQNAKEQARALGEPIPGHWLVVDGQVIGLGPCCIE